MADLLHFNFYLVLLVEICCVISYSHHDDLVHKSLNAVLKSTNKGKVGAENFTHYQLDETFNILIVLQCIKGDADLYISEKDYPPDTENYSMKATSCGIDRLDVSSLRKPVTIGVYGHSSYDESEFILYIFHVQNPLIESYESLIQDADELNEHSDADNKQRYQPPPEPRETSPRSRKDRESTGKSSTVSEIAMSILQTLASILVEILI